ncbi:hypothetical protein FQN53_005037 [Emmonsiellopsis sp. PD_33]|nr:hypothetical protein FQN53_005037 [Emmonsiellopsis sp. PD_33]
MAMMGLLPRRTLGKVSILFALLFVALFLHIVNRRRTSIISGPITPPQTYKRVLDFIDPMIGTTKGGHSFPGATMPYGMMKSSPDTDGENQGGFNPETTVVRGFSHMHDSGTGGGSSLGNFPIFPHAGCKEDKIENCPYKTNNRAIPWVKDSVEARVGYFGITLENNVKAEMTVTNRSSLYRFTFPEKPFADEDVPLSPLFVIDLNDLSGTREKSQASVDATTGRVTGSAQSNPSFGRGKFMLYFCMDFKGAPIRQAGLYAPGQDSPTGPIVTHGTTSDDQVDSVPYGAFVQFEAPADKQIYVRVGTSFKNIDLACSNMETEQPNYDFEGTVAAVERAWEEKLKIVEVNPKGVDIEYEVIWWSGIYRTFISPQDYTGENPLWESDEPYYDSYYCIWDSFRTIHPMLTILDPHAQALMVRSLIDTYRHEGYLPDCRMTFCKGFTQGGSNADVVLADAYVKNLPGIDWKTGYEALVKDAEVDPPDFEYEGRGGMDSWKKLGYIPSDDRPPGKGMKTRSVSRTVEYAYDDFCVGIVAKALGHKEDYAKYMERSGFWKNLYKADQQTSIKGVDSGFVGCLQPRLRSGDWGYQDPIHCSPLLNQHSCYFNTQGGETYEGSLFMYTFYVPQDMATLVTTLGGRDAFVSRLDYLHDSGLLYLGDEQAFLTVFQYHYAGRPALSAKRAHYYIPSQFNHSLNGIPGNDDSGAMGSFLVFSMMGLFPVAGQDVYLITPPFFEEVRVRNPLSGQVAVIRNRNFDPAYKAIYIQSVKRDGKVWSRNWIGHDFFEKGGVLEIVLGREESGWGTAEEDLPPSLSTGGFDGLFT